jgi:hypothetical protein
MCRLLARLSTVVLTLAIPSAVFAQGPVLMKHKFTQGAAQNYKSSDGMKQSQSIMGMKQETSMTQESYFSRTAESVDASGKAKLKVKFSRIKMDGHFGPGIAYKFDSDAKDNDKTGLIGAMVGPAMEKLSKAEYSITVDGQGKVGEVRGFIEQLAELLKANPASAQFLGADSNESAKVKEQQSMFVLSDKPVKVGDTWEVPLNADLGKLGKVSGKTVCKYEGPDQVGNRKTAKISFTTNMAMDLEMDQGPAKVKGRMESTKSSGIAQFDVEKGVLVSLDKSVSLSGKLNISFGGMMLPVDAQQEQTSKLELVEK